MSEAFFNYFGESVRRLVMASFVFVLLLPILFFIYSLFQNSWQKVEQRMLEKHQLISEALVEPFTLFVSTRQQSLQTLGQELHSLSSDISTTLDKDRKARQVQETLDKHLKSFGNFISLSYAPNAHSHIESISTVDKANPYSNKPDYSKLPFKRLPSAPDGISGVDMLSPVFLSSISGKPVILIKHEVLNQHSIVDSVVYAEVSLKQVANMCSQIKFGMMGHCAVVDYTGRVIAHPSKDWSAETKDLSEISIVQKMLAGESGTTEFYSPALKADMVAGFSAIPALGWGVMIPQPKAEITSTLDNIRFSTLVWLTFGVLVALFMSGLLTRKITQPINLLINRTRLSGNDGEMVSLGEAPKNTPTEIKQLWVSFSKLLAGLQSSNKEIKRLNKSLQEDILIATAELREVNKDLYKTSCQDYLTSLSNRRHFTSYVGDVLTREVGKNIGIIIIDIDKFKDINDKYGHEAGDLALKHLTGVLNRSVRSCDLVARLGGDEFIVYAENPSDAKLAILAERIRKNMENSPLELSNQSLQLTLSIGTTNCCNDGTLSIEELLRFADHAMYNSKTSGRNQVSAHKPETPKELVSS